MQLYLAGKVEGRKWAVVKDRTSVTWVSSDGSNHSEHLWGGGYHPLERIGNPDLRSTVASELLGKLRTSQGLVAYLDTPDSYGSIVEIATMSALNKPCFLVILAPHMDFTESPDDPNYDAVWGQAEQVADAYWLVSSLPSVRAVTVESEAEAADVIRGYVLGVR